MTNPVNQRLAALRDKMTARNIDLAIIPHADPHQSEYQATHWHVREFFSGFSGSAGTLVVMRDGRAALWTDSRYFLQADLQLAGSGIELMKEDLPGTPTINEFIISNLGQGCTVGIDGMLFSISAAGALEGALSAHGIGLSTSFRPAEDLWNDRPALPGTPVFIHDIKYAGETAASKISRIIDSLPGLGASSILISALDAIAWTLNLRGSDVPCNPVFTAFLYLSPTGHTLLIDRAKITDEVAAYLDSNNITTAPYESIIDFASSLPADSRVLCDPAQTSSALISPLGQRMVCGTSPISLMKAVKNPVQIQGIHNAMIRDGVALARSVMELQRRLADGETTTEMDVADILTHYRSQHPNYRDASFGTIAGYKGHGAIVHYEADAESNSTLAPDGLLLIDSGAQYLDGTTDITRTISLGNPTEAERHDFTLVMKGHIALGTAIYPEGTRGAQLDVLARQFLWHECKTYLHGTGHGVGFFLNVHEGPHSIRLNNVPATLQPGMLTSNEPGLYIADRYGIRCENLVLTVPYAENEFGRFYTFETVTLFPFDRNLFDLSLMTDDEIHWVNEYHAKVREALMPHLDTDDERRWLTDATLPL